MCVCVGRWVGGWGCVLVHADSQVSSEAEAEGVANWVSSAIDYMAMGS